MKASNSSGKPPPKSINAGFILSRSRFRDGGFEALASYRTHDALVGKGTSATGGKYEWIDKSKLLPGETYYYKLEDVDFNGVIHTVGGEGIYDAEGV
jgi:hypothetical protein